MIRHIVMWKIVPNTEGSERRANIELLKGALEGLMGIVPEIRSLQVGTNILKDEVNFDLVLQAEFDDLAALERYQQHPEHQKVATLVASLRSSRAAIDYEF